MKKALQLKLVSARVVHQNLGALGESVWFVHMITDGTSMYRHWSKSDNLKPGECERVIIKVGEHGGGKPISRKVNIILA